MFKLLNKKKQQSDFSAFFSKPASEQKKVMDRVTREVNKEQKGLYDKYKNRIEKGVKTG